METFDRLGFAGEAGDGEIMIGERALESGATAAATFAPGLAIAVLVDEHVLSLHHERIAQAWVAAGVDPIVVELPRGEAAKSFAVVEATCRRLVNAGVERGDLLVGIGGGAATDTAGFIAAILLRGVSFVSFPTSLLGMVDASIGGKTAIDLPEGKNLVGAFHQPRLVTCDLAFLATLSDRERRAGLAEIVKIAWISDPELLHRLESDPPENATSSSWREIVRRAIELKLAIVARDEREKGERMLLNFGHTWGHAIETEAKGALLHGEAIALGLVAAVSCSVEQRLCPHADLERLVALLTRLGLPVGRRDLDPAAVTARVRVDKKRASGRIRAVLTGGVGSASVAEHVSEEAVRRAVEFLRR